MAHNTSGGAQSHIRLSGSTGSSELSECLLFLETFLLSKTVSCGLCLYGCVHTRLCVWVAVYVAKMFNFGSYWVYFLCFYPLYYIAAG